MFSSTWLLLSFSLSRVELAVPDADADSGGGRKACGGIETGRGRCEDDVALGPGAGGDDDGGGCGWVCVGCETGISNSCPPIMPPCDGVMWPASTSSGTWFSCGAREVG